MSTPPIWPFTCYAWEKEVANDISGTDLSPEELRWEAYKYQSMGNMSQYVCLFRYYSNIQKHQLVQQQLQQTKSKFQALLGQMNSNQPQTTSSAISSNPFSALQMDNASQSNPFGNSTTFGTSQTSSPFGTQQTQSVFGTTNQASNNTGIFGGATNAPTLSAPSFTTPSAAFANPQPASQPFGQPSFSSGFNTQSSFGQTGFGSTSLSTPASNFTSNPTPLTMTNPTPAVTTTPTLPGVTLSIPAPTGPVQGSNVQVYMGPKFSLRNVPEDPPPPEVCN